MKRTNPIEGAESVYERINSTASLADQVTEVLMEKISKLEFPPNSRLPTEQAMSERFGVSRSVIREAISRLKSKGLVVTKQGSGAFVRKAKLEVPFQFDPGTSDFLKATLDVVELRRALECEIASIAATRRTKKDLAQIRKAFSEIEKALASGGDGIAEDQAFNLAIAKASKNPIFPQVLRFVRQYIYYHGVTRIMGTRLSESNDSSQAEHAAIMKAIELRDPAAAAAAVRVHLENAAKRIEEADFLFWTGHNSEVAHELERSKPSASKRLRSKKGH